MSALCLVVILVEPGSIYAYALLILSDFLLILIHTMVQTRRVEQFFLDDFGFVIILGWGTCMVLWKLWTVVHRDLVLERTRLA